jgi:2-keto-4-pentenoate hydratase/2-oxohepta-3-ene-1,7-dioic acid hydratase in catechol pathway
MRLVTYRHGSESRLGVLLERKVVDVQFAYQKYCLATHQPPFLINDYGSMLDTLNSGNDAFKVLSKILSFAQNLLAGEPDETLKIFNSLDGVTLLSPLSNPGKVICIGGNFPSAGKLTAPDFPVVFLKPASTITGFGMPVWISEITANVAYEVELVVVIGKRARNVAAGDASNYIAGFTLANDIGDRVLEKRTSQWTSGKMFDTFTPLGPAIVTPNEIAETHNLPMETWVNDQQVQTGNTGDMFFDVNHLVSYLSTLTTLEPGDLILTGSPKLMNGEPAPSVTMKAGDTVRISVGGLGELINPIQEEPK